MPQIIVKNIPEKFTVDQLFSLLDQANIPCTNRTVKIIKSNRTQHQGSTGRYCILNLESDVIARTAIQAINQITLTIEIKEIQIRAMNFLPNFRSLIEDSALNIVIYNLPTELTSSKLNEIFTDFGNVLSAVVNKRGEGKSNMGYVLFDSADAAVKAIAEADGKYLGTQKIVIKPFKTIEQRQKCNPEVILGGPNKISVIKYTTSEQRQESQVLLLFAGSSTSFTSDAAADKIKEILPFVEFDGDVCIKDDPRPAEINCGGAAWIFTCKDHVIAQKLIEEMNNMQYTFDGVNEHCRAVIKLSKGMLARTKAIEQQKKREQFQESGANVQVFGLKITTTEQEVRTFMSKYGEIENISAPRQHAEITPEVFHYNVLFKTAAEAENAISNAAKDEESLPERLSENQLRVIKYAAKKEVKSTTRRGKNTFEGPI